MSPYLTSFFRRGKIIQTG
uniref:Uncharacterized protein n=1 Tax=Anguilla anguilla TaxID=7936 RepID=A0A0E9QVV4_ANGAN